MRILAGITDYLSTSEQSALPNTDIINHHRSLGACMVALAIAFIGIHFSEAAFNLTSVS
jgi:hypothetical protein